MSAYPTWYPITVDGALARRGRPPVPVDWHPTELRITPVDGQPINEWNIDPNWCRALIACQEGGEGTDKRLHYHVVVETTYSDEMMKRWVYTTARAKHSQTGNAVYRSAKPHEHTFGYVVKNRSVVELHGYTDSQVQQWILESDEYYAKKKNEAERRRKVKALGRTAELKSVEQEVRDELKSGGYERNGHTGLVNYIVEQFLAKCRERDYKFPTRTQMEGIVNHLRYDVDAYSVVAFYSRNLNV